MSCKCGEGAPNTGFPSCLTSDSPLVGFIVMNLLDSNGDLNKIAAGDVLNPAYLTGKINEALSANRWFPIIGMENVTQERAEAQTEEAASGSIAFIKQGVKSIFGEYWYQSRQFQGKLDEWRCQNKAVFGVYANGDIYGKCIDDSGDLYPISVNDQSWIATFVDATDTTVSKVNLTFQLAQTEQEKTFYKLTSDDYTFSILTAKGLLDAVAAFSNEAVDGVDVQLDTIFGSKNLKEAITGTLTATGTNVTDSTPLTGVVVTENGSGSYSVAFDVEPSGKVIQLNFSGNGYDFSNVGTFTTP